MRALVHLSVMNTDTATPTIEHFLPLVGSIFTATPEEGGHDYALVSVDLTPAHDVPDRVRPPFVLVFHSDTPDPAQGMRMLDVPGLGVTGIFMVPMRRVGDRIAYEAVYN